MRKLTLTFLVIALLAVNAAAYDFYSSARGNGLGFSYMLLGNDPAATMYNPSVLGYNRGWQAQGVYSLLNDYEYSGLDESPYYGHFGVSLYRPNAGTFSLNTLQNGSLSDNTSVTTLNTIALSYGRNFARYFAGGLSLKYFKETNFDERSAFEADLGFSYRSSRGFIAAFSGENLLQSKLKSSNSTYESQLPRRERIGAGYVYDGATFQGSFLAAGQLEQSGFANDYNSALFNLGSEWWLFTDKSFSVGLRAGFTVGQSTFGATKVDYSAPAGGISFNYNFGFNDVRFDYAFNTYPYETSDGSSHLNHTMAVTFGWGGLMQTFNERHEPAPKPVAQARKISAKPVPVASQPQAVPENAVVPDETRSAEYLPFNVTTDVADLSTPDFKRVIFYLRPQQVVKTASWKLFILKAKVGNFNYEEGERWAVAVIDGKGVPPINVVWDCLDKEKSLVKSGKYYFILTAVDFSGQNYCTDWTKFNVN